ncbi:acetolactate synthase catalytic subunit [Mesorhizobium sp. M7A.F.Ca.MR.362.00.0.0]|uniref:acetolactate synthase catalytic subunit n=1 Tax=Mesorhizobium sp. M7A.F.Ca.MR.362.00.0.0 TaxID=2496779 RepID=UPI000FD3D42A|nr:acetolactate synthase catalytic subunit [Mesorhizobium sp. M7A.F.Ca.MR.362.00.0.0]RUU74886.1 acetolactate synthase catalytic subunit [Mesorhizobium sp. M7A.F.Ca.MR.362.00.0.0]RWN86087.1 MAG: acetolactate synthase catalytic subunit [Mesorhizobium sp.]
METVAERIAAALRRNSVELIFAQSLPSAVVLACEKIGIRQIAYRQENMGGAMADGYSRISGRVGVVCAQNGPAAALLVPPLSEAFKASIPVVALVQEVERHQVDRNAFQELDHIALFSACSKWTRRVITADRIEDYVDSAFIAAASGRPGPSVLMLPADLLRENVSAGHRGRTGKYGKWPLDPIRPSDEALAAVAKSIARAESPVILAGGGAVSPAASEALAELQSTAHLPVFTTNMGKGAVDERAPLTCGVLGALNGPRSLGYRARAIMDEADLVFFVGTRTNQNGTDSWRSIPSTATVVHLDIDPCEIGRNYESIRLVGDIATTIQALTAALRSEDLTNRSVKKASLVRRIAEAWAQFEQDRSIFSGSNQTPLRPERIMRDLQSRMTPEAIIVADASYSSMWIVGQLRGLRSGQRFITPRGLAGLGSGLPLGMGAKLARPNSPVVVLVGDGGFAHSWAELETLVRSKINLIVIILNNGVLGYQKDAETVKFGGYTTACHFGPVDHAALARACGCEAVTVKNPHEFGPALDRALSSNAPVLIEVISDPDAHPPISLFTGTLGPRTLEASELV